MDRELSPELDLELEPKAKYSGSKSLIISTSK